MMFRKRARGRATETWYFRARSPIDDQLIEFATGLTDERAAERVEERVGVMLQFVRAGVPQNPEDLAWARTVAPKRLVRKLVDLGALPPAFAFDRGAATLAHVTDYCDWLARERGVLPPRVARVRARLSRLSDFAPTVADLSAGAVREALHALSGSHGHAKGNASTRRSHYTTISAFLGWCVDTNRLAQNPLAGLSITRSIGKPLDRADDRRRVHEPITEEQYSRLIEETIRAGGNDRAVVYALAVHTGLRASTIRRLRVGDFELTPGLEAVHVPASATKSRKKQSLPITDPVLIELLEHHFRKLGATEQSQAFPGLPHNLARMLRADLIRAGVTPSVDGVRVRDFHGLRAACATMMLRAGASPKSVQHRLGHSKLSLTTDTYAHSQDHEARQAAALAPKVDPT